MAAKTMRSSRRARPRSRASRGSARFAKVEASSYGVSGAKNDPTIPMGSTTFRRGSQGPSKRFERQRVVEHVKPFLQLFVLVVILERRHERDASFFEPSRGDESIGLLGELLGPRRRGDLFERAEGGRRRRLFGHARQESQLALKEALVVPRAQAG